MPGEGLPQDLGRLFGDGGAGRSLEVDLPPGRLVAPYGKAAGTADAVYWLSDQPAGPDLWVRLQRAHPRSGLWPVFANSFDGNPNVPWAAGEVRPQPVSDIDRLDAGEVMAGLWGAWVQDGEGQSGFEELRPFSRDWPGLAPAPGAGQEPEAFTGEYVRDNDDGTSRIMLVAAARSADVVTAAGWQGPLNYAQDMAPLSSVLRSWETRFGARVIQLGFDTLHLAVAAPPVTAAQAQGVAAEHFAFCPDNIVQGPGTITLYAAEIRGENGWSFWWD